MVSEEITAVYISTEHGNRERLRELWAAKVEAVAQAANTAVPRLEIVDSPYRRINQPILDFVDKIRRQNPGRIIALVIPELVEPHWYEYLLHNLHGKWLKTQLYLKRDDRMIVINSPWYLHEN